MCGIAGIADFRNQTDPSPLDRTLVERMTQAQLHRGPDGSGLYAAGPVVLGHRRLSIIDLSEAGRQPMSNETATVWTVYNGEIYNHAELRQQLIAAGHCFRSHCDTEVLVHGYEEWGEDKLLSKLRGMFAFAIYDQTRRRLVLARDRLGIKPLYYSENAGRIGFASEVRALTEGGFGGATDRVALAGFLLLGSVPSPRTIVKDIHCLLPGHYLVFESGPTRTERYWDLNYTVTDSENLAPVLRDAVKRHLVSDVPLGIFLSGGVDSAGVAALAQGHGKLKTLTISFAEAGFDEADHARKAAEHFGAEHHETRVGPGDFVRELPRLLAAMDQPSNDGVNSYFVAKAAKDTGLTVVLSGLGGDELFWGYPHYHRMARWGKLVSAPDIIRRIGIGGAVALGRMRGKESWIRLAGLREAMTAEKLYLAFRGFFPEEQMRELMGASEKEIEGAMAELCGEQSANPTSTDLNYIEIKRYLHDQLLRDTDVFGMANSVEVRVPLLDDEVVAAATATPSKAKTNAGMNKPLLVRAITDSLVEEASRRQKRGFTFPLGRWMRERGGEMREMAMRSGGLERKTVGKLWSAFEQGRLHWSRAWSLVVLGARA